jgi:hypothetical protein
LPSRYRWRAQLGSRLSLFQLPSLTTRRPSSHSLSVIMSRHSKQHVSVSHLFPALSNGLFRSQDSMTTRIPSSNVIVVVARRLARMRLFSASISFLPLLHKTVLLFGVLPELKRSKRTSKLRTLKSPMAVCQLASLSSSCLDLIRRFPHT